MYWTESWINWVGVAISVIDGDVAGIFEKVGGQKAEEEAKGGEEQPTTQGVKRNSELVACYIPTPNLVVPYLPRYDGMNLRFMNDLGMMQKNRLKFKIGCHHFSENKSLLGLL
jgi:hypothetical protein